MFYFELCKCGVVSKTWKFKIECAAFFYVCKIVFSDFVNKVRWETVALKSFVKFSKVFLESSFGAINFESFLFSVRL